MEINLAEELFLGIAAWDIILQCLLQFDVFLVDAKLPCRCFVQLNVRGISLEVRHICE